MRKSLHYFLSTILFYSAFTFSKVSAQNNNKSWTTKFGFQKSFIENKGQFIIPNSFGNASPVLFAVDQGGTKIYFTKMGVTYAFLEATKKPKDAREIERERREEFKSPEEHLRHEREEHELKTKSDQVTMLWQNANANVEIEANYVTSDYHNYYFKQTDGEYKNISYIKGYKKITYKNLYPNIDVDYMFSEKGGLKYSLTLHSGADPSVVKMVYDNHVSLNTQGEIRISTKFGDIIDHAPLTFYEQNSTSIITSSFVKSGKTVSFQLENYDNTKTVVIDPWTQTPAFASNWDCVWECEKDAAGNVYIIGGVMPLQLIKYNSAGAIQWTYNTPYDTTSWLGTFATDNVGNSYVTNGTSPGIIKVNTAGVLQWTTGGGALLEYWNIAFNCDQTKLITGGTDNLRGAIFDINTTNGAILSTKIVAYGSAFGFPPSIQEVRSITPCGNGKYYFLTLDSIGFINQNFSSCGTSAGLFKTTSTHGFSYKCENFRRDNTGIMAIRADVNFVYTHNGTTLFKRSLANASIIASVAIPGGAATTSLGQKAVSCSGIDIDAAGNIYVGSTNAVTKFSPALVQLGTVAVPFNVYDVHVSAGGDVIACGSTGNSGTASRTGYIQSISSLTAGATLSLVCCDANICQVPNQCSTAAAFNLTAGTAGGTWSGTGITNAATGTFNPGTAGVGTHVITYSLTCGVGTTTINVISCGSVSLCVNSGSLVASGGAGTYTWSSTTTSVSCASCPGGACIPFVCAGTTVPTWTASGTTVAAPASTVFPIKVKDIASGVTFTFTTLASIPPCTTTSCPTLTMSVASQTNVNCFGSSTGTANVSTTGGTGPYTYTWSPGALTGASQTGLAAGTYTIAIKDANACPGTGTVTITQPTASLSAVISGTTATGCGSSTGGATVTASGGTAGYTYSWSPSGGTTAGVTGLGTGNHTVVVTDSKGCVRTAIATVGSTSGPTLSVVSQASVNCFGANTGTATVSPTGGTGPFTYTWTPVNLNGASQTTLSAGTYTVNASDASGCTASTTLTITQPATALSAAITGTTAAGCGSSSVSVFWTENFGVGCSQNQIANGVNPSVNGNWTVTNTGVNDASANQWFISATEAGMGVGVCGDGCLGAGGNNRTLHVSNVSTSPAAFIFCPTGDCGAAYDSGFGSNAVRADKRAESPTINCTGQSNITISFKYIEGGQTTIDDATLWYFDGAVWAQIDNMPKTTVCGGGQGLWDSRTMTLPASANNNANIKIGYRWVNNDDGVGTDPSFAVDDITLSASSAGGSGSATVTASGGTPTYTYNWAPSGGTTASVSNLSAGSNTVTVTDSKGCTATAISNITSSGGPTLSVVSQASVNCFGASTGTATVSGSGGTGPYTFTWTPGNLTGASQPTLSAGTYTINVMDANSCAGSGTLVITQPTSSLSAAITATVGAGCGTSTGGATVTASGGTAGYTYSWTPSGGTTAGVSNLGSGNNTVIVTDANSCTVSAVANITSAGGPTLSVASQTDVNCFGAITGTAAINASGGTGPISYTWTPGNLSGASQTGLAAGTYTINALDANSCASSTTVLISQPSASLAGVISNTTAAACGLSNGSASVTASGGTPVYTYSWSPNGGTTSSVSNLSSGNNTVTITDSKGCTQSIVVSLSSVSGPTLSVVSQASVNCLGGNTGTATVNASGGTGPYTYTWMPGNLSGASQSSLSAGVYTITVNDANQCSGSGTVSISQPTAGVTGTITTTPTGCGTSVGSATVSASGGVPAYTYSWSPTAGSGTSISGLAAGSYSVKVTDAQGCSVTLNTSINTNAAGPGLSVSSQTNAACFSSTNAGATIAATGTGPFSYSWSPTGGNANSATGLSGGSYTVFVSDASLCVSTITLSITQPPAIVVTVTNTTASCGNYDGSATVIASGGTGSLTPLWSVNSNSTTVTGLSAGTYSVLITDAAGCSASAITNINSVGSLTVSTSGNVVIHEGDNTLITAYAPNGANVIWSPATGLACSTCSATIASPTVTTEYCAYTSIGSCIDTSCLVITVDIDCKSKTDYSTPNAFTPNGDGVNDEFCLNGWSECVTSFYIGIYNRWGEKVYSSEDVSFCWDGKFLGNPLNSGVYVFYIKASVKDIGDIVRKGHITLFK